MSLPLSSFPSIGSFRGNMMERSASDATSLPAPVSVSPSQFFEGVDGQWSTFELRVGTPAQNFRLLPGTSSTYTLVVLPQGCTSLKVANCADTRGGLFNTTASSTWKDVGPFNLGFEDVLGDADNGEFGFDTVGLGFLGSGGPVVNHSVVAGVVGTDFYLGLLGLNPHPTNFTTQNNPEPTFMHMLKNDSAIPSLSYSYNAGAPYRLNRALGTLILGGYDASLFDTSVDSTYPFLSDQSRDLSVNLASVTSNATADALLPGGTISTFIDSSVAEIYLPVDACEAFEKAFHLTYNSTVGLYLINDALHSQLLKSNPSVTFAFDPAEPGRPPVNVTIPYAGFDLQVQAPLVSNATKYFPLKRAANATQYTLGRAFLQEAYIIVDYERGNFSLHQRLWDPDAKSDIVTIAPLSSSSSSSSPATTSPAASGSPSAATHKSGGVSGGAIAGIVIGVLLVAIGLGGAALWFYVLAPRRRRAAAPLELEAPLQDAKSVAADSPKSVETAVPATDKKDSEEKKSPVEADSNSLRELHGEDAKPREELEGSPLTDTATPYSPQSNLTSPAPLSEILSREIYEMPGSDVSELQGSPVPLSSTMTRSMDAYMDEYYTTDEEEGTIDYFSAPAYVKRRSRAVTNTAEAGPSSAGGAVAGTLSTTQEQDTDAHVEKTEDDDSDDDSDDDGDNDDDHNNGDNHPTPQDVTPPQKAKDPEPIEDDATRAQMEATISEETTLNTTMGELNGLGEGTIGALQSIWREADNLTQGQTSPGPAEPADASKKDSTPREGDHR